MFIIISTAWAVIALVLLIVAWRLARAGRIVPHRNIMILLTAGAWIFIINYIFVQRYGGEPGSFPIEYVPWMALHGSLGLVPLIGATPFYVGVEPDIGLTPKGPLFFDGKAHDTAPLRPRAVVNPDILESQDMMHGDPGQRRTVAKPAIDHDLLVLTW